MSELEGNAGFMMAKFAHRALRTINSTGVGARQATCRLFYAASGCITRRRIRGMGDVLGLLYSRVQLGATLPAVTPLERHRGNELSSHVGADRMAACRHRPVRAARQPVAKAADQPLM